MLSVLVCDLEGDPRAEQRRTATIVVTANVPGVITNTRVRRRRQRRSELREQHGLGDDDRHRRSGQRLHRHHDRQQWRRIAATGHPRRERAPNGASRDQITFDIPGTGPFTITPTSSLPVISDPVIIDATTQPGFTVRPIVELDGVAAGGTADGFFITAEQHDDPRLRHQPFRHWRRAAERSGRRRHRHSGRRRQRPRAQLHRHRCHGHAGPAESLRRHLHRQQPEQPHRRHDVGRRAICSPATPAGASC